MKNIIKLSLLMPFEELKKEKAELDSFLCSVSKILEKNYCTRLYLYFASTEEDEHNNELAWEQTAKELIEKNFRHTDNTDNSAKTVTDWETASQLFIKEENNTVSASREIQQSDICMFLFGSSLGKNGSALFDCAEKACIENKGKTKIFSYFRELPESAVIKELTLFRENSVLSKGLFCGSFSHIDTVKFRILLYIYTLYADFIDLGISYGQCVIDNIPVMSLENVGEFANNPDFLLTLKNFKEHEKKYKRIKNAYDSDYDNEDICSDYFDVTKNKFRLQYKLDAVQKEIFDSCLEISRLTATGYITEEKKLALSYLENGKLKAFRHLLDRNPAGKEKNETEAFFRRIKRKSPADKNEENRAKELRFTTESAKMQIHDKNYTELVSETYENICLIAFESGEGMDALLDYVAFLVENNNSEKALIVAKMIADYYASSSTSLIEKININMTLAKLYAEDNDKHSAANAYITAIGCIEAVTNENSGVILPRFEAFVTETDEFFRTLENSGVKKDYFSHTISLKSTGERNFPGKYLLSLASDYYDLAQLYFFYEENYELAETNYITALRLFEENAKKTSVPDSREFVSKYRSLGNFYQKQDRLHDAKDYYLKALECHKKPDESIPDPLDSVLAAIHSELADIYDGLNDTENAEASYLDSINIYKSITLSPDNKHFLSLLAEQYDKLGMLAGKNQQFEKAQEYYDTAISVYQEAENYDPGFSALPIAGIYEKKGETFTEQYESALSSDISDQASYNNTISAYSECLQYLNAASLNKTRKNDIQSTVFFKIAETYEKLSMHAAAEKNYIESISCYNALLSETPKKYRSSMITTCYRLAELYFMNKNYNNAKNYYDRALAEYKQIENPSDSISELAGSCYASVGIIEIKQQNFPEAEKAFYKSESICLKLISSYYDSAKNILAKTYNGMSILFSQLNQTVKSLEYSIKKREIHFTSAKSETREFCIQLANDYTTAGAYYCDQTVVFKKTGFFNITEEYLYKAISLFNEISDIPLKENNRSFALAHEKAGELYKSSDQNIRCIENYEKAISIYADLIENYSVSFRENLAKAYYEAGAVYDILQDKKNAEHSYLQSLAAYEAILADTNNIKDYRLSLLMVYNRLSYLYDTDGNWQSAELYYIKAVEIEEELAKKDEDYRFSLTVSYQTLVDFYEKYPCEKAKTKRLKYQQKLKVLKFAMKASKKITKQ